MIEELRNKFGVIFFYLTILIFTSILHFHVEVAKKQKKKFFFIYVNINEDGLSCSSSKNAKEKVLHLAEKSNIPPPTIELIQWTQIVVRKHAPFVLIFDTP